MYLLNRHLILSFRFFFKYQSSSYIQSLNKHYYYCTLRSNTLNRYLKYTILILKNWRTHGGGVYGVNFYVPCFCNLIIPLHIVSRNYPQSPLKIPKNSTVLISSNNYNYKFKFKICAFDRPLLILLTVLLCGIIYTQWFSSYMKNSIFNN